MLRPPSSMCSTMKLIKWLLFTLFLLIQSVISIQTCPGKWKGFGNSCYLFVTQSESNFNIPAKSNWYDARKYCNKWKGDLVALTTNGEINFVYTHTKNFAGEFWIGLRYTNKTNSHWTWSNGEKLGITKWDIGEPNNLLVEHCTEIRKKVKVWNNRACHVRQAWICEKSKTFKRQDQLTTEVPLTTAARISEENINKTKVISIQTCPGKWKGFGNSCYRFVTPPSTNFDARKSSWSKARRYCIKMGADLASLTTDEESNFVYSHTKKFGYEFWIGLKYTNTTNSHWAWSNGEKLGITKWDMGEPNNIHEEHCVHILRKQKFWNNKACHVRLAWICEKPKTNWRQGQPATEDAEVMTTRSSQDNISKEDPVVMTTRSTQENMSKEDPVVRSTEKNMRKDTNSSTLSTSMALYIFLPMILLALITIIILLIRKDRIAAKKKPLGEESNSKTKNQDNNDQNVAESGVYTELDDNREPEKTYMSLVHYENLCDNPPEHN